MVKLSKVGQKSSKNVIFYLKKKLFKVQQNSILNSRFFYFRSNKLPEFESRRRTRSCGSRLDGRNKIASVGLPEVVWRNLQTRLRSSRAAGPGSDLVQRPDPDHRRQPLRRRASFERPIRFDRRPLDQGRLRPLHVHGEELVGGDGAELHPRRGRRGDFQRGFERRNAD